MRTHRILSMILALTISIALCSSFSFASDNSIFRASPTLSGYSAKLTPGHSAGDIVITYDVEANVGAESVGVSSIKIYKSSGNYVTTITGSESNGLVEVGSDWHRSSYTYHGISGTYYYAKVTVFATIDGVTDSRTITTNTVQAP